ncbi:MAG: hypothetical protein AABY22_06735, partial [Nanoarchaeota archaeon]
MINKKKVLVYSIIPVILSIVFISGYFIAPNSDSSSVISEGIKRTGIVEVTVFDGKTGEIKSFERVHNLVVDAGLNATRDILGQGTSFGAFSVISVGNASNATSA